MSAIVRYLTHPQVAIDPAVPVPDWGLSELGRERTRALAATDWLAGTTTIVSSAERKAIETAEILASALRISVVVRPRMHENDRSATGFLPPPEFEAVANLFFAHPDQSIRGWERAIDAQVRIVAEVDAALADAPEGDVLLVGHGGVGTLLLCHLAGHPITRASEMRVGRILVGDQPAGGGNWYAFERAGRALLGTWHPMERATETSR